MGTLSTARKLLNANIPTKTQVDLFVNLGNSLSNGLLASRTADGFSTIFNNYYFPSGDQTHCRRGAYGLLPYHNITLNADNSFSMVDIISRDLYADYNWQTPIIFYANSASGASIFSSKAVTWSANAADSLLINTCKVLLLYGDYLRKIGYEPRITIIFSTAEVAPSSQVASEYQSEIEGIVNYIRTNLGDSTIKVLWMRMRDIDAENAAYADGVDLVTLSDFYKYDFYPLDIAADDLHMTTLAEVDRAQILAAQLYNIYYGGTIPTASNVVITGTIKINEYVSVTYTYTGQTENTTAKTDTVKLEHGHGSRIEWYYADDANGLNEIRADNHVTQGTSTKKIGAGTAGKYIEARVFPVSMVKPFHGAPAVSGWQLISA